MILIEGHKHEKLPQTVFIRKKEDLQLLEELTQIEMVLLYENAAPDTEMVTFHRDDPEAVQWLINYFHRHIVE